MDWNSRRITAIIENALHEDRATRDATSYACIDPDAARLCHHHRQAGLRALGLGCIAAHPRRLRLTRRHRYLASRSHQSSGNIRRRATPQGQSIAVIRHNARVILSCERVILNIMQRMSGIATSLANMSIP